MTDRSMQSYFILRICYSMYASNGQSVKGTGVAKRVICLLLSGRQLSFILLTLCSILAVEHFHKKIKAIL
jgi:hypothetical protein